ncbi:MAG: hypothetical protein ACD_5C00041G0002 [uncultured bacterium]|nr:MAG: hypothetical protein ACD_5C00041G0002 [uncultured bacterium]
MNIFYFSQFRKKLLVILLVMFVILPQVALLLENQLAPASNIFYEMVFAIAVAWLSIASIILNSIGISLFEGQIGLGPKNIFGYLLIVLFYFSLAYVLSWFGNLKKDNQEKIENNNSMEIFEKSNLKPEIKKYAATAIIFLVVISAITILKIYNSKNSESGSYDQKASEYVNKKFGFKIEIPSKWKKYTVQEAISCPTIKREYADDYYLLTSPTANYNETFFVINKASLSLDYFTNSPMDQVRQQIKGKGIDENMVITQNPGLLDEQKKYEAEMGDYKKLNINGVTVYRKDYNVGGAYREDNYFVSKGSLMHIFYYVPESDGASSEAMKQMREAFGTLAI